MKVRVITHPSGEQIPIILDLEDMPIALPCEFIISRRYLSTNTLVRNARELSVLYQWLTTHKIELTSKLLAPKSLTEADIKGSLIEALRLDQTNSKTSAV
ncbi:MAG TPA: integrase, partial [Gammaproteobacteria bacterium]|nr:integrase [Gammaproteobacteria bacterium]